MNKEEKEIKEIRHEVIEYAIFLENYLDGEILSHFGLDAWESSYHMQLSREREFFKRCFLNITLGRKLKLIREIINELGEKLSKDFISNEKRFRDIRNKFAHHIYPEIGGEFTHKMVKDSIELEQKEWKEMYNEAKVLYWKIINEIDSKFYAQEPRRRKHKRFDQVQLQKVIEHYEGLIKKK